MREVIIDDTPFPVRPLTRGEIKALRKEGINLSSLKPGQGEDAMDKVFGLIFTPETNEIIDSMPNPAAMQLWTAALQETYGAPGEEKN